MAGGKQSPRQKMINMMYLVLTALLALNISKEVLNAFVVVNIGLKQQLSNLEQKNHATIEEFETQVLTNEGNKRIEKYRDQANEIGVVSKELVDYIETMKVDLIKLVDGVDETEAKKRIENPYLVGKKDDYDKPTFFFGTNDPPGNKGKASELKKKLAEFKDKLMAYVTNDSSANKHDIDLVSKNLEILDTKDPENHGEGGGHGETHSTWEMFYFYHLPASAALTELTKWQNIVRGAESELLTFLWNRISATAFKFDRVEAKIIPKSSFVISGSNFEADVFLGAFSTSQKPTIVYGTAVDSSTLQVAGEQTLPEDQIIGGMGKLVIPASGQGERTVGGVIKITNPSTGQVQPYPFSTVYNVSPPTATVSPTKMNVFYRGLDNPISVSVPGVAPNNISVSASGGSISGGNGNFIVKPGTGNECNINVSAKMQDGKTVSMGTFKFRVKRVPTPTLVWANQESGGKVSAGAGSISPLIPQMKDFDFEVYSTIKSFDIAFSLNGSYFSKTGINGNQIPGDVSSKIKTLPRGTKVFFDAVKMSVPGGETRTTSASFVIQ